MFHHLATQRAAVAGQRIGDMRKSLEHAAETAKRPTGFRLHDLRHRRVTTWLIEGKDVVKVQAAVGHHDISTTLGYMHLVKENLRSLVDDVPSVRARLEAL